MATGRGGRWLQWSAGGLLALALAALGQLLLAEWSTHAALSRGPGRPGGLRVTPLPAPAEPPAAPLLVAGLGEPGALARWEPGPGVRAATVAAPGRPGRTAARIVFPASRDGLVLGAVPRDWRQFETLELEVHVDSPGFALGVRVDDRDSHADLTSRFEVALRLDPGWRVVRLPVAAVGRRIDLSRVFRVVLYPAEPGDGGRSLVLASIRLTRG
jgi:hypothetical protein